jgi:hypothetical protein
MLCQTVIFSIWIIKLVKYSSHLPQLSLSSALSSSFLLSLKFRNLSIWKNLSCLIAFPYKAVRYCSSVEQQSFNVSLLSSAIYTITAKNKHIFWTVISGNDDHPSSSVQVLVLISICLYQQSYNLKKKKREWKRTVGKSVYWCGVPLFVVTHWDLLQTFGILVQ